MPRQRVYEAVTERLSILDVDGTVDETLMPALEPERIMEMYRFMVRTRAMDDKALKMQRQGRMGTWPPHRGQEAAQIGVAAAMTPDDWLVPAFREHGAMMMHGVPAHLIYAFWRGDERGSCLPEGLRCLPISVPVGSQWQHGNGIGMALKLRNERAAAVTFGGDGSTSEGDFHEALNFAAVFKSRTVFVIQNNQWAISVPLRQQTAAATLAQKAHAYGMPGIQVDGNDLLAVYAAASEALERARRGDGPTLIEALTYRVGDHTTADDASRYRSAEEVEAWVERDPIARVRRYLSANGMWDEAREQEMVDTTRQWVDEQVRLAEEAVPEPPEAMLRHMYADMPPNLREQMQMLAEEVAR